MLYLVDIDGKCFFLISIGHQQVSLHQAINYDTHIPLQCKELSILASFLPWCKENNASALFVIKQGIHVYTCTSAELALFL